MSSSSPISSQRGWSDPLNVRSTRVIANSASDGGGITIRSRCVQNRSRWLSASRRDRGCEGNDKERVWPVVCKVWGREEIETHGGSSR